MPCSYNLKPTHQHPQRTVDIPSAGVLIGFMDVDAREQEEARARLLASVVRDLNDAVIVHDFEGRILAWNRGAERMYGYGEAEAVGMNIRAILADDRRESPLAYVEPATRGAQTESFESKRLTKDGRWLDVWLTVTPLLDATGKPIAVATTERDITERKQRQAEMEARSRELEQRIAAETVELETTEREFHALADNIPALFSYIDPSEHYRYVNRRYADLFKVPAAEIIGKTVEELLGCDGYREVRPHLRKVLAGDPVRFQRNMKLPDGEHNLDVKYVPELAESGQLKGFFVLVEDITETRRRELALHESKDRLRAILETAAEGIITIDGDGMIHSFNPAAERIFGFAASEAVGQKVELLMPSSYWEKHNRSLRRYRKTHVPRIIGVTQELSGRRKDGSTFPIELSVSNVDHMDLFTGVVRDISERKLAEQREREHRADLAHVLRVATVGELASGLAHELNQPLSAISNNIHACVSHIQSEKAAKKTLLRLLKQVSDEALRAGTIVHSIRDMVEKRAPRYERVDLRLPIRRTSSLLSGEIERHDIELLLEGMDKPVPVNADTIQIEQVLINLAHNAIDSIAAAGGRKRQLAIALSRPGKGMVEVAVRDTGRGVDKAAAERLFESFFSTKPHHLGVGLAVSRTIIEAHGGRLWIEPRRGRRRGATFRFTLPVYSRKRSPRAGTVRATPQGREGSDG